jgi:quercetin dioxygenase-like cupin family protein
MKIFNYQTVTAEKQECCTKTTVRWLTTKETGFPNCATRLFEMESGGYSPLHKHPEEHQLYVLQGHGTLFDGEKTMPLQPGDVVLVEPNKLHQIRNSQEQPLMFLCTGPYAEE